jgi:hypothetical protein
MIESDPYELKNLVLPVEVIRERRITVSRKIRHEHFVKVPWAWVERLAQAHCVVTYRVALHLLYRHWKAHGHPISLANGVLQMEGVARTTKWRGLRELEQLGLITIERRPRKSPLVTVHAQPQT